MTVKDKLLMGLGAILLMVMVVGGAGIWNMMRSLQSIEDVGASARGTMQLANAQNALWQLRYGIPQFILFTDKVARDKIVASVEKVTAIIDQISSASREQANGIEQVNRAVSDMDRVVQQNAAVVEQAAAAADSMQSNAHQLYESVSAFKLGSIASGQPAVREHVR